MSIKLDMNHRPKDFPSYDHSPPRPAIVSVDLNDLSSAHLANESDVEQKLIFPLLTASEWAAIPSESIHTKRYLPPVTIGKGSSRKVGYYPDYSIWMNGFPVLIVEAKSPLEGVDEGYREAQLYAHEVNKAYPSGVAPIQTVVCTDGKVIRVGSWDANDAVDISVSELQIGTNARTQLLSALGQQSLFEQAQRTSQRFKPTQAFRPINYVGGDNVLNRPLGINSFATEIAPLVRMFFASEEAERIDEIIQKAYVSSVETTKYDQILESFLRDNIHLVQDPSGKELTTSPNKEILLTPEIRKFKKELPIKGHMQLMIGSVGSGKSLFCLRYKRYLQPDDIKNGTYWTSIDFNTTKENLSNLEPWLCERFIESFQSNHADFDLFDLENLKKIFSNDVKRIRQIYGKALESRADELELRIADEISKLSSDPIKFVREICRHLNGDRRQVVVVVFDNVDKLDRNDQIKIFQVAQWFKSESRSFCLLPLRDETYEQFKDKPPLDAFINAIHFTITPPRFIDVVRKRLELCLEYVSKTDQKNLTYELPDGKKITYPSSKLGEFLKTLYIDIFRTGRRVSWLLEALAGRDVRHSLEMFTRVLMSGHLDERQITGTVLGTEQFHIRDSTIINVLMKTDYYYFDDKHGFISNILFCDPTWKRHSNFLVFELLDFLVQRRKERSEIGSQGYFSVSDVIDHVNRMGFDPGDALSALHYLLSSGLVVADHLGKTALTNSDFLRAHASGFVHARLLLENINYISGIAPALYVTDREVAAKIGRLSTIGSGHTDIQYSRKREIAFMLVQYLRREYDRHCDQAPLFENLATASRFAIRMIESALDQQPRAFGAGVEQRLV